jgi:hypothetical protein
MKAYTMTYQTNSEVFTRPAGATSSATSLKVLRTVLGPVGAFFRAIGTRLVNASENSSRMTQINALNAKTDAELAKMGLRRDQIAHYVFRDLYYC